MLSFELKRPKPDQHPDELEIILDSEGLEALMAQLRLLQKKQTEHAHLMSEAWGGTHLENKPLVGENTAIHHVKISLR